jgi:LacI family transcriptional regulator
MRVLLRDVAREAGVGTSVTSRVLNGDPTVSIRPETRSRILEAARRLGYTPNAFARGLRLAQTMTLGMVVPNLTSTVNAEIIRGAAQRAADLGYMMLIADADLFARTTDAYRQLLLERRVDGLLIASARATDDLVEDLSSQTLPFVFVNRRLQGQGISVTGDDEAASRRAVAHLAALGHRRIAHIAGPAVADTAHRRLAGYRQGMAEHGLPAVPDYVVAGEFTEEGGYRAMSALLALTPRPTAVTASSLGAAIGAMAAARQGSLVVPDDISIVGFHDAPLAAYLNPPLTTVRMPLREMAERGVVLLVQLIAGQTIASEVVQIQPVLVERASTSVCRPS